MNETKRKYNPGDTVWVMSDNTPSEKLIFAVVESLSTFPWGDDNEFYYHLVDERYGTGWGNNEGGKYNEDRIFSSKEELIDCL